MESSTESRVLRAGEAADRVTNVELFFDLVYVFAITQLSHLLVEHPNADGALRTAVLLAMVWQIWVYTTWAANYLDPNKTPARAMLIVLMLGSLVLAAALPEAFSDRGMLVAVTYAAMQSGRALFVACALRGERLQIVFLRILPWTMLSSAVVIVGAVEHGHVRLALWAAAIAIDLIGAGFGFYVPGLGGSATTEWTISGSHFAERCQGFVLIALGESIVVVGTQLRLHHPSTHDLLAFTAVFALAVGYWWIYFDRAAEDSAHRIADSSDPGRLARNAFHWIHPLIIGGIIVTAAGDERVLEHPAADSGTATAWLMLGGAALFLAGHAAFKAVVWRVVSWPRIVGLAVLCALAPLAAHLAAAALAIAVLVVILGVAVADRLQHRASGQPAAM